MPPLFKPALQVYVPRENDRAKMTAQKYDATKKGNFPGGDRTLSRPRRGKLRGVVDGEKTYAPGT